jgi:uncharacterized repeat protein (TIGR01451 family)
MPQEDKNKISDDIRINIKRSGLAEFTKRSLPSDEEVREFDEVVEKEFAKNIDKEEKFDTNIVSEQDEKIEESLNEIYDDGKGGKVDVKRLEKVRRHGFIFKFFVFLFVVAILAGAGYAAFYFYKKSGADVTALTLKIDGKTEAMSGEEFFYTINYNNNSNLSFHNVKIEVNTPENFVFLDSTPAARDDKHNVWDVNDIKAHSGGTIKIKGMLVGGDGKNGIITSNASYNPEGFSSEFKKEATLTTTVKGIGINLNFDFVQSALVGDVNEIDLRFNKQETNYINSFRVTLVPQDNIQILDNADVQNDKKAKFTTVRPGVWQIDEILDEEKVLPIKFKFTNKITPSQDVVLDLEQPIGEDKYYQFLEKPISYEVMKNDLNLTLITNGSRNNQGVDFGQTLNYSIVYKNKGEAEMKDVVIMAVLESDFLDWTTLKDENKGSEKGNTITWSKEEIPDLADIKQDQEGTIDFSINLLDISKVNLSNSKDFQVNSYAQFSIGNKDTADKKATSTDSRSNTIVNNINSDLQLVEQVRYFNEDNISVGNGPLPFQSGQKTSLKVYWTLTNNLHELNDAKVETTLPANVTWDDKSRTNVGTVEYDSSTNKVTWNIGRLPISVFRADAEFNIGVTPTTDDRDKIMVVDSGSQVTATDSVTGSILSKKTAAKTSKLEDDSIAQQNNDGIVR